MAAPSKGTDKYAAVLSYIQHYQRSIEKNLENDERLEHCLDKLHSLEVEVSHLQSTGIGRTVNSLRKRQGHVGETAKRLVTKWKELVEAYESSEEDGNGGSGDELDEQPEHKKHKSSKSNRTLEVKASQSKCEPADHKSYNKPEQSHLKSGSSHHKSEPLRKKAETSHSKPEHKEKGPPDKANVNHKYHNLESAHKHSKPTKRVSKLSESSSDSSYKNLDSNIKHRSELKHRSSESSNHNSDSSSSHKYADSKHHSDLKQKHSDTGHRHLESSRNSDLKHSERNKRSNSGSRHHSEDRNSEDRHHSLDRHSESRRRRSSESKHSSSDRNSDSRQYNMDRHKNRSSKSDKYSDSKYKSSNRQHESKSDNSQNKHHRSDRYSETKLGNTEHHSSDNHKESKTRNSENKNNRGGSDRHTESKHGTENKYRSTESKHGSVDKPTERKTMEKAVDKKLGNTVTAKATNGSSKNSSDNAYNSDKCLSFEDALNPKTKKKSPEKKIKALPKSSKDLLVKKSIKVEPYSPKSQNGYEKKIKVETYSPTNFNEGQKKIKVEPYSPNSSVNGSDYIPTKKIKTEPNWDEGPSKKVKVEPYSPQRCENQVGASFEEALGFIDYTPTKSKKDKKKKSHHSNDAHRPLPRSEELAAILDLPEIDPNYRPLPQVVSRQTHKPVPEADLLTSIMSGKNKTQRTKVYSGVKTFQGEIPSLQDLCIRILQDNIDALECVGWAPFMLIQPVLAKASAPQLAKIEHFNLQLSEETDDLWKALVQTEFKCARKKEDECWRDVYERSLQEREDKLGNLTAKIKNKEALKTPQRTTKLAYVNSQVKPPRNVIKQQMKHGTSRGSLPAPPPKRSDYEPIAGPSGQSSTASTIARTIGLLREGPSTSIKSKKRPAPLMQKTLKFMKTSYKR